MKRYLLRILSAISLTIYVLAAPIRQRTRLLPAVAVVGASGYRSMRVVDDVEGPVRKLPMKNQNESGVKMSSFFQRPSVVTDNYDS
jgi:hypothetical protein